MDFIMGVSYPKAQLFDKNAFLVNAQLELDRIKRYGHRATFLLIRPHMDFLKNNGNKADYEKKLYQAIKEELRTCDTVYLFNPGGVYAAILPDTHEGGGESAAIRLKRKISQLKDLDGNQIASDIGVVSVDPVTHLSLSQLLERLKMDLERDRMCQTFLMPQVIVRPSMLLLVPDSYITEELKKGLAHLFEITERVEPEEISSPARLEGFLKGFDVIIADRGYLQKIGVDSDQLEGQGSSYFNGKIVIKNLIEPPCSVFFMIKAPLDIQRTLAILCGIVSQDDSGAGLDLYEKKKFLDALTAISSSTHQMNQSLQIIMGMIDLLLLDLDEPEALSKEKLRSDLNHVKKQVHYISEINQKIHRLTKL